MKKTTKASKAIKATDNRQILFQLKEFNPSLEQLQDAEIEEAIATARDAVAEYFEQTL